MKCEPACHIGKLFVTIVTFLSYRGFKLAPLMLRDFRNLDEHH